MPRILGRPGFLRKRRGKEITMNVNVEIAQTVMGWELHPEQFYSNPNHPHDGPLDKIPDFLWTVRGHNLLRETLLQNGDELKVTPHEPTPEIGKLFTARLVHRAQVFEETESDERWAVCKVAL